jgi:hypothetical protein
MGGQFFWIRWWGQNGVGKLPNVILHQHQHDLVLPSTVVGHHVQLVFEPQTRHCHLGNLLKKFKKLTSQTRFPVLLPVAQTILGLPSCCPKKKIGHSNSCSTPVGSNGRLLFPWRLLAQSAPSPCLHDLLLFGGWSLPDPLVS